MLNMGKPKSWITWGVRTDGFMFRQADLTGEALYHPLKEMVNSNKRRRKGETKWCRVADESVVVMNLQLRKAGNRLEGKTEGTASRRRWTRGAKSFCGCEGTKVNQSVQLQIKRAWEKKIEAEMSSRNEASGGDEPAGAFVRSAEYWRRVR